MANKRQRNLIEKNKESHTDGFFTLSWQRIRLIIRLAAIEK